MSMRMCVEGNTQYMVGRSVASLNMNRGVENSERIKRILNYVKTEFEN